ncbi:MAG: ABC transporter ATP-binding protein [bacterium]|nr:ABC transporter ATP-binding protein [bacterium]
MPATKAQQKAVNKYMKNNYDNLRIVIPKGQKATVEAAAKAAGESINQYTQKALLARMGLTEWPQLKETEADQ